MVSKGQILHLEIHKGAGQCPSEYDEVGGRGGSVE